MSYAAEEAGNPLELHVWGLTEKDADRAHKDAKTKEPAKFERADHVTVTRIIGMPCPIRRRDPKAIAQDASYNKAWAIYESDSENTGGEQA